MLQQINFVERPSLLSAEVKADLVERCYPLVCSGFVQEPCDEVLEDTQNHVLNCQHLWLYEEYGRLLAFTTWDEYEVDGAKVLYLGGVMVAPEAQGKGVAASMIDSAWERYPSRYLVAQTQNPVMYSSLLRGGFQVYPSKSIRSPGEVLRVALGVTKARGWVVLDGANPQFRLGTYGKCLYGVRPVDRDEEVERFFSQNLDFNRGDAFLLVAERK